MKSQKASLKKNAILKPIFWTSVALTALGLITAITGSAIHRTTNFQIEHDLHQQISTQVDGLYDKYSAGEISLHQYNSQIEQLKRQALDQMLKSDENFSDLNEKDKASQIASISGTAGIGVGFGGMLLASKLGFDAEKEENNSTADEEEKEGK